MFYWQKRFLISAIISLPLAIPGYAQSRPEDSVKPSSIDSIDLTKSYVPSQEVVELTQQSNMNENGRRIFYANRPIIEKRSFGLNFCRESIDTKKVILGCYTSDKGIFIKKVTDSRLSGIMPLTAAHELLHAVYYQLPEDEKIQINKELRMVYASLKNSPIKKLVESYKAKYPEAVDAELHSILGTEVTKLNPRLEKHYANYFNDRLIVVAHAQKYERAFAQIIEKANAIDKRLKTMRTKLDSKESAIKDESKKIERQRAQLQKFADNGNIDAYNSRLTSFNQRVANYNQQLQSLKEMIANYNELVKTYNDLSAEEKSLNEALLQDAD
jgi:hypothetical protein